MERGNLRRFGLVWLGLVLILSAWAARTSHGVIDIDLWHQLSLARETAQLGGVPQTDSYAYTPTLIPLVHHEWGAGIIEYWALSLSGAAGIVALTFSSLAAACLFAVACASRQKADARIVALAGIMVAPLLAMGFQPVRAQAYSLVFLAILLLLIELDRQGARWALAAWCPVFVLWVNCHASYVLAFAILGLYWLTSVWERRRNIHILAVMALCAGLIAVNPYGLAMYPYLWRALRMPRTLVDEWSPVWHGRFAPLLRPFLISLALVLYAVWQRRDAFFKRTASAQPAATILLLAYAGMHIKLLPYFAIVFLAYFPGLFGATGIGVRVSAILTRNRNAVRVTWAGVMLAAIAGLWLLRFWTVQVPDHGEVASYPVGAVDYLAHEGFKGNLMTQFNEGAYISWKLYPRVRVSVDSRYEAVYPEWLIPLNESAYGTGDWRGFIARYPTDVILTRRGSPMEASLTGVWKQVYRDGAYSLFARPGLELPIVDNGSQTFNGTLP
jgi:hypothetical protein